VSAGTARLVSRLPAEVTSFVGRRQELAEARRLLSASRLLTLTGPGGVGKTRLALRLADQVRRAFPDGVHLIELDALEDASLVPQTVAAALGIRDSADDALGILAGYLADRQLLLVLDNCEHLVDGCAVLVSKVLAAAPGLRILATSRHVLGVEGEQIQPVPPLPVPDSVTPDGGGAGYDAVGLFADRAAAVLPEFCVDERNRDRVLEICQRLDGMPLAIELAAVRLRALSLDDIRDRLGDRFGLLVEGSRGAPSRQRTLGGAIDWSYDLCSPQEQLVWGRLSVFPGTFDLEAAEAVASGDGVDRADVLGLVTGLVDKSILLRQANSHGLLARYRMLETIRRYGLRRLEAGAGEDAVRARHLGHYRQLALRYQQDCFSPRQVEWIQRMTTELPNLRVALEFGLRTAGQTAAASELASAVWNFWFAGGFLREGLHWLERSLAANPEPTRERAAALWTCAFLSVHCGDADAAERMLAEGAELAERFDDDELRAHLAMGCGQVALLGGDLEEAAALLEKSVAQHRAVGNLLGLADSLILLAAVRFFLREPGGAGEAADALELCEANGASWTQCYALWAVALHRWMAGEHGAGAAIAQQAIRTQRSARDWTGLGYLLEVLAWCTAGLDRPERVGGLLGAARTVWRLSGGKEDETPTYHAFDEVIAEQARAAIGDEAFEAACARGRELSVDEVITYALEERSREKPAAAAPGPPETVGGLTPREQEVAQLIGEGLTNRQVAARLTISQRTAEGHVEKVLTKLGFTSRAQIAAWVAAHRT
jgi:predicted ATPase/DNA-binding CsgD family transcriptional regulator